MWTLQDHPLRQCAKRLQIKAERLLKNITDRKERSDPPIPSDLPGRTPSTILIKPNGINGHSRSLSGTPTPLLSSAKSTIRIPPSTLSKKKSKDVSFPDSPAIVRTAEGMSLFKTADEELDIEESNVESRLREFTLEDLDEFVDPDSEEETALTGDKRKLYAGAYGCCTGLTDAELIGMARARKGRENALDDRLLLGTGGLTYGGKLCNAISSLATVTLHCSTPRPPQVACPRSPPLARCSRKAYRRRSLGGNDGRRSRRRIPMPLPKRSSG